MADFLTGVLLFCAVLLTLAWLVAHFARRFLALPRLQQVVLVLAVCISTVCAQKTVTNENAVIESSNNRIIESAEASASGSAAGGGTHTSSDIASQCSLRSGDSALPLVGLAPRASRDDTNLRDSVAPCETKSAFWHLLTPSNSLVITWQNVLLHRLSENLVSFQVEFFANGDFTYRYDFSQLPSDDVLTNAYVIAAPGIGEPFVLSCEEPLEGECLFPTLDRNLTSLTFRRLEADDQPGADHRS